MNLGDALYSSASLARSLGCSTTSGAANKTCVAGAPASSITRETYSGSWGPVTDGITFPLPPETLLDKGLVNDATVVLGAQTNDSNLFLFRSHTKAGLDQPNDHPDGALKPLLPEAFAGLVGAMVGPRMRQEALHVYPPDEDNHVMNVHQLGNMQSDQMHCNARHRASLLNRANPGRAFLYRFDYWYMSNPSCSAVPNYHLPYLGAAHQDEVTFVLGQPNFMEDGSCCGAWGLNTSDCPRLRRCESCYAPKQFGHSGYRSYFDRKEWEFALTVGTFWTNVAASGDPNFGDEAAQFAMTVPVDLAWPVFSAGEPVTWNIVLNASLERGYAKELTPHGRPELCAFWDRVRGGASSVVV